MADGPDPLQIAAAPPAAGWTALPERPVRPEAGARAMLDAFAVPLPDAGADPADVVRDLVARAEPGLMASGSGRFLGWVIGGALPVAVAADWLVSAWDQNCAMSEPFPATTMIEQVAAGWILELLDLPRAASVGFVTGGQMANTACLAAARNHVLAAHGWDVEADGLQGAPHVARDRGRRAARLDRRGAAGDRPGRGDGGGGARRRGRAGQRGRLRRGRGRRGGPDDRLPAGRERERRRR